MGFGRKRLLFDKGGSKIMTLNELRDKAFAYAEKQGFHENINFGEKLMLIVSELSEALEADRKGKRAKNPKMSNGTYFNVTKELYEKSVRGSVEEELADAIIRLCGLAGIYKIDLDWHVKAKMAYNEKRPYKHGKKYG
jgi:NTP pyrophosphatase (non-canonical NTP hydrolase)